MALCISTSQPYIYVIMPPALIWSVLVSVLIHMCIWSCFQASYCHFFINTDPHVCLIMFSVQLWFIYSSTDPYTFYFQSWWSFVYINTNSYVCLISFFNPDEALFAFVLINIYVIRFPVTYAFICICIDPHVQRIMFSIQLWIYLHMLWPTYIFDQVSSSAMPLLVSALIHVCIWSSYGFVCIFVCICSDPYVCVIMFSVQLWFICAYFDILAHRVYMCILV